MFRFSEKKLATLHKATVDNFCMNSSLCPLSSHKHCVYLNFKKTVNCFLYLLSCNTIDQ